MAVCLDVKEFEEMQQADIRIYSLKHQVFSVEVGDFFNVRKPVMDKACTPYSMPFNV